ncbi:hypothetical protein LAWI1_G002874 [Lachnellula willkommii]|uniref:Amidohydrolase-related domain-containing protein n=1 Tax=Lachnellula willkommii TaxID=215461 RepID=A0A559MID3_9HELO|nr:hypothetical protein LAWI1_G002874 [Lachnellula willkommii]
MQWWRKLIDRKESLLPTAMVRRASWQHYAQGVQQSNVEQVDAEAIEVMIKQDAILVPTRTIQQSGLKMKDSWTESGYKKLQNVTKEHKEAYNLAVRSGVKIALGTDIGFSVGVKPLSHGSNGSELVYAVEAGLSPLQAIEAATANAPETLSLQAPLSGQLKEGYDADFIALDIFLASQIPGHKF